MSAPKFTEALFPLYIPRIPPPIMHRAVTAILIITPMLCALVSVPAFALLISVASCFGMITSPITSIMRNTGVIAK